ncbi:MAG: hypothetical protein FIA97_11105 [Methylococcaceae bacterium]|nr:hypothetical protein [Desulfuromonas sp.]NJD07029.1 hypothetical protein [Methylococcaceae bacterium]
MSELISERIVTIAESDRLTSRSRQLLARSVPWLAGAGMAAGHIAVSVNCSVPQQGRCAACGSCIVAVGSLVGWALWKKRQGGEFYIDDRASFS